MLGAHSAFLLFSDPGHLRMAIRGGVLGRPCPPTPRTAPRVARPCRRSDVGLPARSPLGAVCIPASAGRAADGSTASLTHVLVEQHPEHEGERVAAEQLVCGVVLGDANGRHLRSVPSRGSARVAVAAGPPRTDRSLERGRGRRSATNGRARGQGVSEVRPVSTDRAGRGGMLPHAERRDRQAAIIGRVVAEAHRRVAAPASTPSGTAARVSAGAGATPATARGPGLPGARPRPARSVSRSSPPPPRSRRRPGWRRRRPSARRGSPRR
jgi:hypothetical protein